MFLEVVTPEAVLLSAEVDSVSVPGINGQFQMLDNHAPIVSVLSKGEVKVSIHSHSLQPDQTVSELFRKDANDNKILILDVDGGVVEMKDNKVIVLAD